ncbi:MAG: GNAT family N-acetyltransferase [Candidatus Diapherotrites archaeon]|uniref:GNAT family N-acetyltransferase n=1 Tax=Candidatus Iainarchaeum sp. TaxID=3101447 RepID=A0A8T4LJ32_9ARCH|nr:GNAT family N-acetyltransferase [Candidatus Diapherotrites archaeon]
MIRRAKSSDAASVYEIYYHPDVEPFMHFDWMPLPAFKKLWKRLMKEKEMWVVEETGKVLAYGGYLREVGKCRHVVNISAFAVRPCLHRKGLGSRLMRFFLARARRQGIKRVQLRAEADNRKAHWFYRKFGFKREGRLRKHCKQKTGYVDVIQLARLL